MFSRILTQVQARPKVQYALVMAGVLLWLYALVFDQGRLASLVMGDAAYRLNWLHEFFHDIRHAAGFPCH